MPIGIARAYVKMSEPVEITSVNSRRSHTSSLTSRSYSNDSPKFPTANPVIHIT